MKSHTPGPWRIALGLICADTNKGQVELAMVYKEAEYQAVLPYIENARLIAAAPDLLEACYAAMEYDAAIKQAALEERNASTRKSWVGGKSLDLLYANWITKAFTAIAKAEVE